MCGIVGVVDCGGGQSLRTMCQTLRHRGPDGEGYYTDGAAGLGMVRLSIIDLAGGHQPMTDERQRYHLVFNGEIYNYRVLRDELQAKGHRLITQADTEVLVHLFEDRQERCVEPLNGDFAFAVWDQTQQQLFLARDRLGVKPLYYWHRGKQFAFASELKALLQLPEVSKTLDYEALDDYLTYLYVPSPHSIFRDIKKLPAGCWLVFSNGTLAVQRYWQPPQPGVPSLSASAREQEQRIVDCLKEAVRLRLVSDVPLGAFLSGGIDSTAVVAFMAAASTKPVQTFSIGFEPPDDSYNELPAARIAATVFHTDHHELIVKPDIANVLPHVVRHMDEPFADSSATLNFLISREAKHHVTVALTGIGGDEVFGGYPRYLGAHASLIWERLPRWLQVVADGAVEWLPESTRSGDAAGRLKRFVRGARLARDVRYLSWISYATATFKRELYAPAFQAAVGAHDSSTAYRRLIVDGGGDYLDRVETLDLQTYLPDDLLVMGDKMSMAHGLEVRVPFCDHALIELAAAIPMAERLRGFRLKGLLKSALRGVLPPALLNKRKQGFMLPLGAWLQRDLKPMCRELLTPASIKRRGLFHPEAVNALLARHAHSPGTLSHQVYALLVLELWFRTYLDDFRCG